MGQEDLRRRLAQAEAAVAQASLNVRRHREHLDEIRQSATRAEILQAEAVLDMLEDSLKRRMDDRNMLVRHVLPVDGGRG